MSKAPGLQETNAVQKAALGGRGQQRVRVRSGRPSVAVVGTSGAQRDIELGGNALLTRSAWLAAGRLRGTVVSPPGGLWAIQPPKRVAKALGTRSSGWNGGQELSCQVQGDRWA